jgi:hypothetical protein
LAAHLLARPQRAGLPLPVSQKTQYSVPLAGLPEDGPQRGQVLSVQ